MRRKSNAKPWISEAIRQKIKRRKAIFRGCGRNEAWKRLDKAIKKSINFRKDHYNKIQKEKLENLGRSSRWFGVAKYLMSDEVEKKWEVTDLRPDQCPKELANELADHFVSITNENSPLSQSDYPTSTREENFTRLVTVEQVALKLKKFKVPKSRRRYPVSHSKSLC